MLGMTQFSVEEELKVFKARLDPKIGAYFDTVLEHSAKEDDLVTEALRHAREMVLAGGKRLRAALMYYGYIGAGGTDEERMMETSVSIELIHTFLLVHDDIIDRDELRHGVPTLHRRYADFGKKFFPDMDTEHFGMSIALIIGDMLSAFGNDIIFRSGFPRDRVFNALSKLQGIVAFTAIGQARDVYMEYKRTASEEEIIRMYTNKTAKYTIEGPIHLGMALAGAQKELLDAVSHYAVPLGIAFQIQDDILGIFGTPKRLGKPVGSDIKEGKVTLLVSRALRDGTPAQQRRITEILMLGERLSVADVEEFRALMKATGALDGARNLAAQYVNDGKQALEVLHDKLHPRAYHFLSSIAEYMIVREY